MGEGRWAAGALALSLFPHLRPTTNAAPPIIIMRKLKYHEQKLLKKVNFLQWKREHGHRELTVVRRYHLQDRDDYKKYNTLCGLVTKLVSMLKLLAADDPARIESPTCFLRSSRTWASSQASAASARSIRFRS